MDNCGDDNHGRALPPIFLPGAETHRAIRRAVEDHEKDCLFRQCEIEKRVRTMENRFYLLCGFMIGSGLIGGATGASLVKLLTP